MEEIKHLRQKNHLTQKELGIAVDFLPAVLDVRLLNMKGDVRKHQKRSYETLRINTGAPVELFTAPVLSEPRESAKRQNIGGV